MFNLSIDVPEMRIVSVTPPLEGRQKLANLMCHMQELLNDPQVHAALQDVLGATAELVDQCTGGPTLDFPLLEKRIHHGRSWIYSRLNPRSKYHDASFPKPFRLKGGRKDLFYERQVDAWLNKQAADQRGELE